MNESTTLELRGVTIRRAGATLSGPLSLRSTAQRLGLVGDSSALLEALTGRAQIAAGSAWISGCELERALARGVVGLSASDPLLPASFTTAEYLQAAARLSHGSRSRAIQDARRALQRFGLADLAARKLEVLELHQRRALGIALSTLTAPTLIWLDAPLCGLDAPSAEYLARLCAEAARQTRVIVTSTWPAATSFERALLETCDELLLIERGELLAQGAPIQLLAATGRYSLKLAGDRLAEFSAALANAGCKLSARGAPGCYSLELPRGAATDLVLDLAIELQVIVLELDPIYSGA